MTNTLYTSARSLTDAKRKIDGMIKREARHHLTQYCAPGEYPEVIGPVLYHYPRRNQYRLRATVRTGELYTDISVDDLNGQTIVVGQ